ncbi:hypothetical protein C8F04DRAFT_1175919 [Mycena alexandri]|uniref:Uncharacterized protein n=1 Tax=Mycena alexandri TaxID=1745969 RepID=A0AAD6TAE9_9AGAR|nr:hypothetical protein C8F04DRAFT_1175919 [Mycena alexandri]
MWTSTASDIASTTFGALCIASALPFVGVPFPTRGWATYYADKNLYLSQLSGGRLTPRAAGWASAALRIAVGSAAIYPPTREASLIANTAVVVRGTFLAHRDGRPMRPQWTMLGALGLCLLLGRL